MLVHNSVSQSESNITLLTCETMTELNWSCWWPTLVCHSLPWTIIIKFYLNFKYLSDRNIFEWWNIVECCATLAVGVCRVGLAGSTLKTKSQIILEPKNCCRNNFVKLCSNNIDIFDISFVYKKSNVFLLALDLVAL